MSFAQTYLKRYASGSGATLALPDPDLFFSIVIPVFNEIFLLDCLNSLVKANPCEVATEIILVLNRSEHASIDEIEQNEKTKLDVNLWVEEGLPASWSCHLVCPDPFPRSKSGPGLARKIGMDIAIRRFSQLDRKDGLIVSMDADTKVDGNYFTALINHFQSQKRANACTVYFEHLRSPGGDVDRNNKAVIDYELYLRMVKVGLRWAGYPMAIHTLGSAFAVRASAYVKAGGMGVQQSGEDFYFLHKTIQLGDFWEINEARVYPSGRESDRVLFGTGPFIRDYPKLYPDGYRKYSWKAFADLSIFFAQIGALAYPKSMDELTELLSPIKDPIVDQLMWKQRILNAFNQSGDPKSFQKWIWRELDGLQVVRYLNLHQKVFGAQMVVQITCQLLSELGISSCPENPVLVLNKLRKYERDLGIHQVY